LPLEAALGVLLKKSKKLADAGPGSTALSMAAAAIEAAARVKLTIRIAIPHRFVLYLSPIRGYWNANARVAGRGADCSSRSACTAAGELGARGFGQEARTVIGDLIRPRFSGYFSTFRSVDLLPGAGS
jgi:hypothetical protein